jgi:hypothetical protein
MAKTGINIKPKIPNPSENTTPALGQCWTLNRIPITTNMADKVPMM